MFNDQGSLLYLETMDKPMIMGEMCQKVGRDQKAWHCWICHWNWGLLPWPCRWDQQVLGIYRFSKYWENIFLPVFRLNSDSFSILQMGFLLAPLGLQAVRGLDVGQPRFVEPRRRRQLRLPHRRVLSQLGESQVLCKGLSWGAQWAG